MSEFTDDFDYPGGQLGDHGWTVTTGTFDTADSVLVAEGNSDGQAEISHEQPNAFGTFEIRGIQNEAGRGLHLSVFFICDATTVGEITNGYGIVFKADGTVSFAFYEDGTYSELPIPLASDLGGNAHDVRIERDPDKKLFEVFFDGQQTIDPFQIEGMMLEDSSYWTMGYGGQRGSQRIDGVHWSGTGGDTAGNVRITDVRAVQTVENTRKEAVNTVDDTDISTPIPDPPLVAGRKTAVVFDTEVGVPGGGDKSPDLAELSPETTVEMTVEAGGISRSAQVTADSLVVAAKSGSFLGEFDGNTIIEPIDGGQYLAGQHLRFRGEDGEQITISKATESAENAWSTTVTARNGGVVVLGDLYASEPFGTTLDGPGEYVLNGTSGTSYSFTLNSMPTFDLAGDTEKITLTLSTESDTYSKTLSRHRWDGDGSINPSAPSASEFGLVEMPALTVGVVPVEGGWGTLGEDSDYANRAIAYEMTIRNQLEFMQRCFPTPRINVVSVNLDYSITNTTAGDLVSAPFLQEQLHDGKLVSNMMEFYANSFTLSSKQGAEIANVPVDMFEFATVRDGQFLYRSEFEPDDHFTVDGSKDRPFDIIFGIVPHNSLPDGRDGTHFISASGKRGPGDPSQQPDAAALISVDKSIPTYAAHEATHHFVGETIDDTEQWLGVDIDPPIPDPGLSVGVGSDLGVDIEIAPKDHHLDTQYKTTKFDLEDGSFDMEGSAGLFMHPTTDGTGWIDSVSYSVMVGNRLDPLPEVENID